MKRLVVCGGLWLAGLGLGWAQAPQEPPQGPEDIVLPVGLSPEDTVVLAEQDRAQLQGFIAHAGLIAVGRVIASRPDPLSPQAQVVSLQVEELLRGEAPSGIVEIAIPLVPSGLDGQERPPVIAGYRLLVMLDGQGALVGDAALYLVQADYLWRNRRDDVFLRPDADREWTDQIDPLVDYTVIPLAEARALIQAQSSPVQDPPRRGCVHILPRRGDRRR